MICVINTEDGLQCYRMGFIFCGKHPLLLTMIQVCDPGPMGPLVYHNIQFSLETEKSSVFRAAIHENINTEYKHD